MKTKLTCLLLLLSLFFVTASPVHALAKFSTTYQVNYTVYNSGITHVKFFINQINNLSVVYATEFSLNVNNTRISNVRVADENTSLVPNVIKTRTGSVISFPFLHKIVGKDKQHFFTIEYDTEDVSTKIGNTWEINIPKLDPDENTANYNIILTLPDKFPEPAFINPKPTTVVNGVYYFSGKNIGNKPISAVFGQEQYYKVSLTYHLQNTSNKKTIQKIAIPPDTGYQKVAIDSIDPRPISITTDKDGNWLAAYELKPKEELDINTILYIKVSFLPAKKSVSQPDQYLDSNVVWDYNDPIFTIPEIDSLHTAKEVYDYVVDKFTYDFNKINKAGDQITPASTSLKDAESAICSDFTNVFVAITRKLGIPSRELEGYALSTNQDLKPLNLQQDVLHAWPEYFDSGKNTWIQVDPTWAKTTQGVDYFNKLDFDHIVFVIHGTDPSYPIVPGGYKLPGEQTKDVNVEPINQVDFPQPKVEFQGSSVSGDKINFDIANNSNVGFFGNIEIGNNKYISSYAGDLYLAPLSQGQITVRLNHRPIINQAQVQTIIDINGQKYPQNVTIEPYLSQTAIFASVGGFLVALAFSARYLYIRRRRKKTPLYR